MRCPVGHAERFPLAAAPEATDYAGIDAEGGMDSSRKASRRAFPTEEQAARFLRIRQHARGIRPGRPSIIGKGEAG